MIRGRPPKPNEALKLSGSRNAKANPVESPKFNPKELAPDYLTKEGKKHWDLIVPPLLASDMIKEADRMVLGMLCADLAKFHDSSVDSEGKPTVDDKERQRIGKRILDTSDRFGMNPISRSRSGVSKKVTGVRQRPA
jgi:phage terminase small subunit